MANDGHDHGDHDHDHHDHDGHGRGDHDGHDHGPDLEAVERMIREAMDEPRAEIVRMRIRFRVLYDMMVAQDREFAREFGRRYREAMRRDFQPLWDQLVTHDDALFAAEHGEWIAGEKCHERALLGNELFEELEREWDAWRDSLHSEGT
jgi:hypothetical protein